MTTPVIGDDGRPYIQGSGGWYDMENADGPKSKDGTTFTLQGGGGSGGPQIEVVQTVDGISETAVPSQFAVGTAIALKADEARVILKEELANELDDSEGSEFKVLSLKATTEEFGKVPQIAIDAKLTGFKADATWTKITAADSQLQAFQKVEGGIEWALQKIAEMERKYNELLESTKNEG